jgi:hypothetical protein
MYENENLYFSLWRYILHLSLKFLRFLKKILRSVSVSLSVYIFPVYPSIFSFFVPLLYLFFTFVCFLNNFSLSFTRYLFLSFLMFFFPLLSTYSFYVVASFLFLSVNLNLAFRSFSTMRFIFL